jgi:asparagine synthase (glutamine-hydrolysing)
MGREGDGGLLASMARSITYEKWHQTNLYSAPPLAIGRVHLGITNPEPQPIFNEDGSILIVMDGEVFDYEDEKKRLELRGHKFKVGNDPEFCLHMFEEYGEEFVRKLNGSFVLIIYDKRNENVLIANDRYGLRPLYYASEGIRFIFSSEVKAILKDESLKKDIDDEAVADFFAFGRLLGSKTFFKEIKLMPPGSIIIWADGRISEKKYWDIKFEESDHSLSEEYYLNKLVALFMKAVERRAKGKHRMGVFLSGGLDSRTVAGALNRFHPFVTFTYGLRGGDEAIIAEKIARKLGTKHEFTEFKNDLLVSSAIEAVYLTDGMLNCAHIFWNCLFPTARKDADVIFHGTGLDVLLGTYLSRVAYRHSRGKISSVFLEQQISKSKGGVFTNLLYDELNNMISDAIAPLFYSQSYYKKIRTYPHKSFCKSLEMTDGTDAINRTDCFFLQSWARFNLSAVLLRNHVEDRVPSWDNDFFDFILTIPSESRFGYNLYFKFLKRIAPELVEIPYQRTGVSPKWSPIAHSIGYLIKGGYKLFVQKLRERTGGIVSLPQNMGYPDLDDIIRRDFKTKRFFKNILLDERTLSRGYFNREFIVRMICEHMSGKKNWGAQLCALLTFELWNRLFVDPSSISVQRDAVA